MPKFKLASEKGLIICRAELFGRGEPIFLKMALDTGTTLTVIPPEAALTLGVNPAHSRHATEMMTGSGMIRCPIVRIPKFSCFGLTLKKFEVVCHNLPPKSPVEGLLGLNFIKTAKVVLDFPKNTIEIST